MRARRIIAATLVVLVAGGCSDTDQPARLRGASQRDKTVAPAWTVAPPPDCTPNATVEGFDGEPRFSMSWRGGSRGSAIITAGNWDRQELLVVNETDAVTGTPEPVRIANGAVTGGPLPDTVTSSEQFNEYVGFDHLDAIRCATELTAVPSGYQVPINTDTFNGTATIQMSSEPAQHVGFTARIEGTRTGDNTAILGVLGVSPL